MCELLVKNEDNTIPEDAVMDLKSWKRGMVVTVQEDGWAWGNLEIHNPMFTIIKVPDMTVAVAGQYLGFVNNGQNGKSDTTNPLRAFKVDLDHALFASAKLKKGVGNSPITLAKADLAQTKLAVAIRNPLIIG